MVFCPRTVVQVFNNGDKKLKTIHQVYHHIKEQFRKASIPDPQIDAAILCQFVLGLTRSDLIIHSTKPVRVKDLDHLYMLAEQRLNRIPLAYIIGEQDFYGRRFLVNPSVLIPRPETELLVEKAVVLGQELIDSKRTLTIMDLGTGSGVIAITLAKALKSAKIFALDSSFAALETARRNAVMHEALGQVEFIASDWLGAFAPKGEFEIIVSNPPYVAEKIKQDLQEELSFEPVGALFAGVDGTDAIKHIINDACQYLAPGGLLLAEIGYDQKNFVIEFVGHTGCFSDVSVCDDYAGLPRILQARLKG